MSLAQAVLAVWWVQGASNSAELEGLLMLAGCLCANR